MGRWGFGARKKEQPFLGFRHERNEQDEMLEQGDVTPQEKYRTLEEDLTKDRPIWVLSSYGEKERPSLFGNDTSFEETRWQEIGMMREFGLPPEQVVIEEEKYKSQAFFLLESYLRHRRDVAGIAPAPAPAPAPVQTQPKWNFGRQPGRGTGGTHNFSRGGGGFWGSGNSNMPHTLTKTDTHVAPTRPVAFKSSLFASPEAAEAFSKLHSRTGGHTVNEAPLKPIQIQNQRGSELDGEEMLGVEEEVQVENNAWLAEEFGDKIPEEPPPPEYIKRVAL